MSWYRDQRWSVLLYSAQADLEGSPWLGLCTSHGELIGKFGSYQVMISALGELNLTLGPRFTEIPGWVFRLYFTPPGRERAP